jgi:hypothetical protein
LAIRVIIYFFITAYLFYAAGLFALKRLRLNSTADTFIAVSIIVISQQVFTGWVLGFFGRMFAVEVFFANFAISTMLLVITRPERIEWLEPFRLIRRFLRAWWKLCRRPDILLFTVLDTLLMLLLFIRGVIYPPYGWDDIVYHLGEVGFMLQDGNLALLPRALIMGTYPRNIELTYFWNTVFIRHQLLLNCQQIPYILLATLSCYGILRKAGCGRQVSMLSALVFPTLPIVIQQATTAYIDIALSACLLSGINFLVQRKMRFADVVLAGLALGIVMGGKGTGGLLAGSTIIVWLVLRFWGIVREIKFARFAAWVAALLIALFLNGAWIYARNWAVFGNPVYPYIVKIGPKVIFKGQMGLEIHANRALLGDEYDRIMGRSLPLRLYYSWSEPKPKINYDSRLGGFGPLFFVLMLPSAIASLIIALIQRRRHFLFVNCILAAPLLSIYTLAFWTRYVIFFAAAGMLGFAYILGILRRTQWRRLLGFIALTLAFVSSFMYFRGPGIDDDLVGLKYFLAKGPRYWHASQFAINGVYKDFFRKIYPYEQPGTAIFVDNTYKDFRAMCLWNLDFSNRLVYARTEDREKWFSTLRESKPDFLLVGMGKESYQWIKDDPEHFEFLEGNTEFAFFRVIPYTTQ